MIVNIDANGVPLSAVALRRRGSAWAAGLERKLAAAGVAATVDGSVIQAGDTAFDCTPGLDDAREETFNALVVATCHERLLALARAHLASAGPDLLREPHIDVTATEFGAVATTPNGVVAEITGSYIWLVVRPLMTGPANNVCSRTSAAMAPTGITPRS